MPNGTAGVGQIQVTVTTDSTNAIFEYNSGGTGETNNTASTTVTSTLATYPDLQPTGLQLNPSGTLQSGQTVTVQWNDSNTGTAATSNSWTDTLVVKNGSQTLATVNVPYDGSASGHGPLGAGQSFAQSAQVTLPDGAAGVGSIQFTVTVDSANAIFEYNPGGTGETNNTATITQTSVLAPYPDLQVTGLQLSPATGLLSGQQLTIQWDDSNTGNADAATSWTDTVVVKNTTTNQTLDTVNVPYNATSTGAGPLAAGQSYAQQTMVTLPDGTPGIGTVQVTVTTNATGSLFEDNPGHTAQSNNTATTTATATAGPYPDLQVTGLTTTPATGLQSGQSVTLQWNDTNTGNAGTGTPPWVDAVLVKNLTTNTILLSTTITGGSNLGAGQSAAQHYMFRLPAGNASVGQLQFTITVNTTSTVFEYNSAGTATTNNTTSITQSATLAAYPDLTVTNAAITPTTGVQSGATVQVSWSDTNAGTAPTTGPWTDRLVVQNTTTNQTLATVTLYYDTNANGALAAGASASRSYSVHLPDGIGGTGTITATVTTDIYNQVAEYNAAGTGESNNTGSASITTTAALYPDLTPTGFQISPATGLQSGQSIAVQWSDVNNGAGSAASAWTDTLVVKNTSTNTTLATVSLPYDPTQPGNSPLAPGQGLMQHTTVLLPPGNAGVGNLTFTLTVNSGGALFEDNAAHNATADDTAVLNATSGLAPYPDLAVSNVSFSPASPIIGDPAQVTVNWTVTNSGTAATTAGSWVDRVIASPDNVPGNGDDIVLKTFTHTGDLGVGQSYPQSQTFLLPPAFSGQYHLFVQTDSGGAVFENGLLANNYAQPASGLFTVTPIPYADLIVSSVTAPATAASGQAVTLSWMVTNQGIGITNPDSWYDTISLATDPQGQHVVAILGSISHTGALSPGGYYYLSGTVTLPNGISGTYYLVVHAAGALTAPYEFLYANNNTATSGAVAVTYTPPPDLTVTNVQTRDTAPAGSNIDITWTVENLGPGDADDSWPDQVKLQEIGGANRTFYVGSFRYSSTLAAGHSYTRTEQYTLPTDIQGVFQVVVETNPDLGFGRQQWEGTNTNNNVTTDFNPLTITLPSHPDLQVESITPAAGHFQAGGTLGLQFRVINQGPVATTTPHWTDGVYLSLDSTLSPDDLLLATIGNQSALQPGQDYLSTLSSVLVPKDKSGPYYLIVKADVNNDVDEFPNESNNALIAAPITIDPLQPSDLVVSNVIVPSQAIAGSTVQVTYTVTNLGLGNTDLSAWTDGVWLASDKSKYPYVTGALLATKPHTGVLTNDIHNPDLPTSYTQTVSVTLPAHTSGQLYLVPQADLYQQTTETTLPANVNPDDLNDLRADNFKAAPITVLPEPPPDLVVTAVHAPATAAAGTNYTVSWTVANQGNGATESSQWGDNVYLSTAPTWNASGAKQIYLGSFTHNGALLPGQSYSTQQTILLSPSFTGQYVIVVTNPPPDGIWEGPYSTNNATSAPSIVTAAAADLQVTAVGTQPQAYSGETTTVTWTVTNFGAPVWSGTQYWLDQVWFSPDPTFIVNRAILASTVTHTATQPLGTGASYNGTASIQLPAGIGAKVTPITYYIYIFTDPYPMLNAFAGVNYYQSHVYEGEGANEQNNQGSAPLPVYYREPDLVVSHLTPPTMTPHAGDIIPVTWTVTNQGTRDTRTNLWYDGIYLAPDPSLGPQSIYLGSVASNQGLALGQSYTKTANVQIPYGISGNYYLLVFVDDDRNRANGGLVREFQDEGNNITAVPQQVLPTVLPDLQVTAVTPDQQATENQAFNLSYTVTNNSPAATLPGQTKWGDNIYLSVDQFLDPNSDYYLGTLTHNGALAGNSDPVNDHYTVNTTIRPPHNLTGTFYVIIVTDPVNPSVSTYGAVLEGNELNNTTASPLPVIINQPPPADLVVTSVTPQATGRSGQPTTVSWTVTNQGQFPAAGSWTDAVYLSPTSIWNVTDPLVGEVQHSESSLANGGTYTGTLTAVLPPAVPGSYYLIVRTNLFDDVYEGDAGFQNNITPSAAQMAVTVPSLQLGVPLAATITAGKDQLFQVTVPENQTLQVSLTSTTPNAANQIYIRYNAVPNAFQYDASYSGVLMANQVATIPGTEAGTYYVLVRGSTNPVTLLAQLLPFEITNVTPDSGGDSRYVTTVISGAQFDPKALVKLVRPGFAEYEPVSYQVVNSTEIIAVFDLTDAPHGLYDVTVINPDGSEADAPYRYLVEPALPPQVTVGLGGTRILYAGDTGYYGFSLQSLTNVDIPYVQFEFGVPNLGVNSEEAFTPYLGFYSNLQGNPNVAGVPWDQLSASTDTSGYDLATGFAIDLADQGYVGLNFTAKTYPDLTKDAVTMQEPASGVAFTYNVVAAASPLTPDQYVAEQTQYAETLRQGVLNDSTAMPALKALAADATSWDALYLTALQQAGLLRPVDVPPAVHLDPDVASLTDTLAAGILAGSQGDQIITTGNLPAFFAQVAQWYGSSESNVEPGVNPVSIGVTAPLPTASQFNLGGAAPASFEAFNVYVRDVSTLDDDDDSGDGDEPDGDIYYPDLVGAQGPQAADINQFLSGSAVAGTNTTLMGPTGYGPQQFLPEGQDLPFTVGFANPDNAGAAVHQIRVVQQLDPNLDPRTFHLGSIEIGDLSVPLPDTAGGTFQGDIDYSQSHGFILRISAGMDLDTNTATWLIQAIDPNTGEVLQNPSIGLLAPGQTGFISYTVQPQKGLATGTQISADATVLFDNAPPLDTGSQTWTIDGTAPTTTLTATPLMAGSSNYQVTWNAQDDADGSGVKGVTVYVSDNGGNYQIWLNQTTDTTDVYQGQAGHTYTFLALATDYAGNQEQPSTGVTVPAAGGQANLGALPSVPQETPPDVPPAPPPQNNTPPTPNALFTQAQQGIPSALPATQKPEFTKVLQPFAGGAFATGIAQSHANIGPVAIGVRPDGSVLVSGGPGRNQLFLLPVSGGAVGAPLATLPFPIYDFAFTGTGNLWATTGGGPLLQLDPNTGAILGQYGDSLTQSLAIDPATGLIYVSSGQGVEIFNPSTATFTHFSNLRVGSLAFNPADDSLWAALWPTDPGDIIRFNADGTAVKELEFADEVDSIAFGQTGTALSGLLFASHDEPVSATQGSELSMVDLATMQVLAVATGGSRGDEIKTTADGRVLLSQSHQVDVLGPITAPHVIAVNPPPGSDVALPLGSISIVFDQDMQADSAADPNSVLNPNNYRLTGDSTGPQAIQAVTYNPTTRTVTLSFNALSADHYKLRVLTGLKSARGIPLPAEYDSDFTATADLSGILNLQFGLSRSDRNTGTVSFDVTVTNVSSHAILLPVVLHLNPLNQFPGEPQGNLGRGPDGSWLIDLSGSLPADGILNPGQSSTGQTITVVMKNGQPVAFDPSVSGLTAANQPPVFVTEPITSATVGQTYSYQAIGFDPDGDELSYLLVRGPAGMTMNPATGLVSWTPTPNSPASATVVVQVYDDAGSVATQVYTVVIGGVNQPPAFTGLPTQVTGTEGVPLTVQVAATDPENSPLTYWADNLPPGAVFDPTLKVLSWTPAYGAAGTYPDVTLTVSDGLRQVSQDITIIIASNPPPPTLLQPADTIGQEGAQVHIQLQASDVAGVPLTFSSDNLPNGSVLDPTSGLFTWTPGYTQHGIYKVDFTVSNGQVSTTRTANLAILNVNAPPVFQNLTTFQVLENQQLQFIAQAFDPDNPSFAPPTRNPDGSLTPGDGPPATVNYTVSGLPAGATFDNQTLLFTWTPSFTQVGPFQVTFTATDTGDGTGVDLSTSDTVTLNVLPVDRPPVLTPIVDQTVPGGSTLTVPVTATDPDGDHVALTVTGLPAFGTFTDNGNNTGTFQFTPGLPDKGNYTITVTAADNGRNGQTTPRSTQESFVLAVQVASEPPSLSYIGNKVAVVDTPFQLTLQATDLDQQPLTFTATGLPDGATIVPSAIYGQASVSWVPTADEVGDYGVTFVVTNTGNGNPALVASDQQTIHLVVRTSNQAPVLQNPGNQTVAEGQPLTVTLAATDPDGDSLTYSVANAPPGSTFDPQHGILTWTPNLFEAGTYPSVVFGASDGNQTVFQTITVHVTNTDQPPTLLPVGNQSGREGAPVAFTLAATDPDNDSVTFSALTTLPAHAQLDSSSGQFTWTPDYTQAGTYMLTFAATDPSGLSNTKNVTIQIANVDRPPTIQVVDHSVLVGEQLQFTVTASDPDVGDVLTFSATGLPAGAAFSATTGVFTWTPAAGQSGDYPVVFSVSDGQLSAQQTAVMHALLASQAPTVTVTVTPSFPTVPGQSVIVHVTATGVAGIAGLTLTQDGQPVTLDAQGRHQYTPTAPGRAQFAATATDVDGNTGQASAVVKVRDPNDTGSPVVELAPTLNGVILTTATTVTGTVSDSNLDTWTLQAVSLGDTTYTILASGTTSVNNATLATLDPSTLRNGVYQLLLTATNISGRTSQTTLTLEVDTATKTGQYLRSETDLTVQLGAATVNLTRVYDSLDRNDLGSFGYGWSLAVQDTDLRTSVPPTGLEADGVYNPFVEGTRVYLTLPDGERVGFTFAPQRHDQSGVSYYTPAYKSDPGVGWQLASAGAVLIRGGSGFYDAQTALPYNPASGQFTGPQYTLTGPDGTVYYVSATRGVTEEILHGGQTLYFSGGGISSSTGDAVRFIRDAAGRISTIEAPDGTRIVYTYDAAGNLVSAHNAATGLSSRYGYAMNDPHLLTLATAPVAGSGAAINYSNPVQVVPLTADLGGTSQFLAGNYNGNLAASSTNSFTFLLTASEVASPPSGTVYLGVEVDAAAGSTVQPAVPAVAGLTPLVQHSSSDSAFALFAVSRAGLELLQISGANAATSGAYTLHLFIAGDANQDGDVNGTDGTLVASLVGTMAGQTGYSVAADANRDGTIDAADVQLVAANYGFQVTQPPTAQNGTVLTHAGLPVQFDLAPLASDPQGEPVYFHLLGADNGTATLNPDGHTVTFVPAAGFTGTADFEFTADDGLEVSPTATVTVNVSAAPLVSLDFQQRTPRLAIGGFVPEVFVGNFADQQNVVLDPSYVATQLTNSSVATISADGRLVGVATGTTTLIATAQGLQAATAVTVGKPSDGLDQELLNAGLNLYPLSVTLSSAGGTRQLDVYPGDDYQLANNLSAGATGTQYYLSQPGVVMVSPDGLLTAVAPGTVTVTVIHGPAEARTTVSVQAPQVGPGTVDKSGGVVEGSDGSLVAVAPNDLTQPTTVSITPVAQSSLPQGVPQGFNFLAAYQLNLGSNPLNVPVQMAIPAPGLAVGTPVLFLRRPGPGRQRQPHAHLVGDRRRRGRR